MSFRAKTSEAYVIKVLIELLYNNIKNGCFVVNKSGIFFKMTDTHEKICIDFVLEAEKFNNFSANLQEGEEKILFGVNLAHLKATLKPIKKKDTVEFYKDEKINKLIIIITTTKEGSSKTTTSFIVVQQVQTIDINLPDGYNNCISIPSAEYHKMFRDLNSITQEIEIKSTKTSINFIGDIPGLYSRIISFGEYSESDDIIYLQHFDSDQMNNLGRISGLGLNTSSLIQIYSNEDLPLLFKTNIGGIGKINIYIKSKEQMEKRELEN